MTLEPIRTITGEGKPRLAVVFAEPMWVSPGLSLYDESNAYDSSVGDFPITTGMRVSAVKNRTGGLPDKLVWGKVSDYDTKSFIGVDSWVGGVPTDGKAASIDGWVVDLPYCEADNEGKGGLIQSFTPKHRTHNLYANREENIRLGYTYGIELDYQTRLEAEVLRLLEPVMNSPTGSSLFIIPYADAPGQIYAVTYKGTAQLARWSGSDGGHSRVKFVFSGNELVDWPTQPASGLIDSGVGDGIADGGSGHNYIDRG